MNIAELHHVTIPVSDVERSRRFYQTVFGLQDVRRPTGRNTTGAWFSVGAQQLHLIMNDNATFRRAVLIDQDDIHFALRVLDFENCLAQLKTHGFREEAGEGDPMQLVVTHHRGFPQAYVLDPDNNTVEINAYHEKKN